MRRVTRVGGAAWGLVWGSKGLQGSLHPPQCPLLSMCFHEPAACLCARLLPTFPAPPICSACRNLTQPPSINDDGAPAPPGAAARTAAAGTTATATAVPTAPPPPTNAGRLNQVAAADATASLVYGPHFPGVHTAPVLHPSRCSTPCLSPVSLMRHATHVHGPCTPLACCMHGVMGRGTRGTHSL